MKIDISPTKAELGRRAAQAGADLLRAVIAKNGRANIIVATGASQFEMLAELVRQPGIDWPTVNIFHLDEYIGFDSSHPASFVKYLRERFVSQLPQPPAAFHAISGLGDPEAECARVGALIEAAPIDIAFIGIGENAHLAFNDPPADFDTERPYIVVKLDDACRRQQHGEGWFATFDDVPTIAISMSIGQIMKSANLVVSVPDSRKAAAVKACVEGPVSNLAPASILQRHPAATLFLDDASATHLS